MRSRSRSRVGLFASLTLVFVACGGRSTIDFGLDPGSTSGGSGGSSGTGTTGGNGGSSGGTGAVSGGGGMAGAAGFGGVAGAGGGGLCADPGGSPCEVCTCDNCYDQLSECDSDGGCMQILGCADKTGCKGMQCYMGPCKAVIDQNGGPMGAAAAKAQQVGQCRGANKCPCGGGGSGGSGGSGGGPSGGGGSGGTGPLACVSCISQNCPSVQQCVLDKPCRDGVICAMQKCTSGGGTPNLQCMLGCFNGDLKAAMSVLQSLQCFFGKCGQTCGGLIPGLPGGGGGGLPGGGGK